MTFYLILIKELEMLKVIGTLLGGTVEVDQFRENRF